MWQISSKGSFMWQFSFKGAFMWPFSHDSACLWLVCKCANLQNKQIGTLCNSLNNVQYDKPKYCSIWAYKQGFRLNLNEIDSALLKKLC